MPHESVSHRQLVPRPVVLASSGVGPAWLDALKSEFHLEVPAGGAAASELLTREGVAVAVLGPEFPGEAARTFLAEARQRFPALGTRFIVLAAGSNPSLFQDFVDDDT